MKLRNKKTGEIIDSKELLTDDFIVDLFSKDFDYMNSKLGRLQYEWEAYEEPKEYYWFIDDAGVVSIDETLSSKINMRKSIGNYFNTREEAEKAVEKLNVWKRLKDKGFEITGWDNNIGDDYYKPSQIIIELNGNPDWDEYDNINDIKEELDLLFGSEG